MCCWLKEKLCWFWGFQVCWTPPPLHVVKANFDAMMGSEGKEEAAAAAARVIRNYVGSLLLVAVQACDCGWLQKQSCG